MTREEAAKAVSKGEKVRHEFFEPDEWITMKSDHLYIYLMMVQ